MCGEQLTRREVVTVTSEELRALVLEYLRAVDQNPRADDVDFPSCLSGVEVLAAQRLGREAERQRGEVILSDADHRRIQQILWDLILERVLIPGRLGAERDVGWPWVSLTEHGRKVIAESRPVPYDPEGYLSRLRRDAPNLHRTVARYMEEALSSFRSGNYLASAVMLGAASEKLFGELCEAIETAIADPRKKKAFASKAKSKRMRERVNAVVGWCRNHRAQLCGQWKGEEQVETVGQLAHFIRKRRNDAGHPQDPPAVPSHEEMYSFLVVFPEYCRSVYELRDWLAARQVQV